MNFKTVFSVLDMSLIQSCIKKKCFLFLILKLRFFSRTGIKFYSQSILLLSSPFGFIASRTYKSHLRQDIRVSLLSLINKIWIASINFISNEYEQFMNGLKHCCARFVCTTNLLYNIHHIVRVLVNSSNHFYNQMNNEHMYQLF